MFEAGRHGQCDPLPATSSFIPREGPRSLSPRAGPVVWAARTTLRAAAQLSLCTWWGPPLLFEAILPTHSSLLES